ncbi:MAG TPA: amino acid ABC transporter ATP-binding protein [Planctomycetaceae bacterium]|nr:amino acid ABC transporter ATP-binding protein [Planctomycetaceae bacterium]
MLTITNLVKRWGRCDVLKGVGLRVERGTVGVLIGPSGVGKSTVLRCVNGLESFQDGEVAVGSAHLTAGLPHGRQEQLQQLRRCVGTVFQQFNLFPHLSALENVIEAPIHVLGKPREVAVSEARSLLDRVGLGDRLGAMPHQLSGGQQQRVAVARALAMQPDVLLFDEPTSSLDPKMTAEVLSVISDLAKSGQTMLVVTHAMAFARRVATQVHVLCDGVIVESGEPAQVFDAPCHPATRELLASVGSS